jgi:hypothetical protein
MKSKPMKRFLSISLTLIPLTLASCQQLKSSTSGVSGFTDTVTIRGKSVNYTGSFYVEQDNPVALILVSERQSGDVLATSSASGSGDFVIQGQSLPWSCDAQAETCTLGDRSVDLKKGRILALKLKPSTASVSPDVPLRPDVTIQQVAVPLPTPLSSDRPLDPETIKQIIQTNPALTDFLGTP